MKPYGVRMSFRPGCPCCNTRNLHCYRPRSKATRKALTVKNGKRSAKKVERRKVKRELYMEAHDADD